MDNIILLPPEYISALKLFCGKNDVRYYLNGILLEIFPTQDNGFSEGRLVATDGHRLGMFRLTNLEVNTDTTISAIIPLDLLNWKANPNLPIMVTLGPSESGSKSRSLSLSQGSTATSGKSIDGMYPDYRRIIPTKKASGEAAQFNPAYIADVGKAAKLVGNSKSFATIGHNGENAALVHFPNNAEFIGVIMPLRGDAPTTAPAWASECPETDQQVIDRLAARAAAAAAILREAA